MAAKGIVTELVTKIQNQIQANSTAQNKASSEKYMRHIEKFRGMKNSEVKTTVFRDLWANALKKLDLKDKKEIAHQLLGQGFFEDKYFGMLIFEKIKASIETDDVKRVEKLFNNGTIVGWAHTDTISGIIFRHWATGNEENVKYVCNWKNSNCLWLQRASCVTFVNSVKDGDKKPNYKGFTDMLIETCETTIKNQERFVQLGTGWLLRNIGVPYKAKLLSFIENNIEYFTREGLRYAVEKLDDKTKKKMLSLKGKKDLDELEQEVEQEVEEETRKRKKRK